MAISPAQQKYQDDLRRRGSAIGNFFTAPFKYAPQALKDVGAGIRSLQTAQGNQLRMENQSAIQNKANPTPTQTLEQLREANKSKKQVVQRAYNANQRSSAQPTIPTGTPSATSPVSASSNSSSTNRSAFVDRVAAPSTSGFQSTLAADDPAAIGGQMMNRTLGTQVPATQAQTMAPLTNQPLQQAPQAQLPGAEAAYKDAYTQYIQSLAPGKDSQAARQKYLDFIQQRDLGLQEIEDKPIPLRFVTGQQASLQKLAGIESNRLQGDIELAQGAEAQTQAQARAALDFQQEQLRREDAFRAAEAAGQRPIEVGGRLINPVTGAVVYEPPAEAEDTTMTLSPNQTVYDRATGRVLFTAPPAPTSTGYGDAPTVREINGESMQWNPASGQWEGLAGGASGAASPETIEALQGKITMIDELLGHKGMAGSVGPYGISRWTPFSIDKAERQEFAAGVNQLVAAETMDTLINLKAKGGTLGALSDEERKMLERAATRIGSWVQKDKNGNPTGKFEVSEAAFKEELERIQTLASNALRRATQGWEGDDGMVSPDEMQQLRQAFPGMSDEEIRNSIGGGGFSGGSSVPQNAQGKVLALGPITGIDGSPLWKQGLDIDLRKGQPVPTPEAGTVIFVGNNGGFGNQVKIRTAKGNEIWLSHLDGADVRVGQQVGRGQIIGKGGNSGKTIPGPNGDGSHLDLTIRRPDGTFIPPREIARRLAQMEGIKVNA